LFTLLGEGKGAYSNPSTGQFKKLSSKLNNHVRKSAYMKIDVGKALN